MNRYKSTKFGLILGLVLLVGLAGTAFGAAPAGYWYLDDTQGGPYDDTLDFNDINNAECSSGCPTYNGSGNVGAAQTFDGTNDGIIVEASPAADKIFDLQDDENFSVEVWFKITPDAGNLTGVNETEVLIGRSDNSEGDLQWWIGVRNVGGTGVRVAARLRDQEGDGNGVLITNTDDATYVDITTAGWHQAILVKDGNNVSLYVDNTLENTQTIDYTADQTDTGLSSTDAPLSIGFLYTAQAVPAEDFFFRGDIDQVAFYNTALTAEEVNESFTAGSNNQPLEFAPTFTVSDFGKSALGYEFSPNINPAANPAVSSYTLGTAPDGLSLDTGTGDVSWIPTDQQIGPATFNVSATNTVGTTAQDLTVEIVDVCASLDAYWDLNEDTEPFDGQVHGEPIHPDTNDAACAATGCPTQDGDPKVNSALAFDGSTQGLDVAASAAMDKAFDWSADESFTIEFFMKRAAGFMDGETEVIIGRLLSGGYQWWIGLRDEAGGGVTPRLYARLEAVNGDGDDIPITNAASPTDIVEGTWYHVALVYDHVNDTVSLYVDGMLEAMETIAYDPATGFQNDTNPLTIGYWNNNYYFNGSLDEIAFFGSVADAALLQQHANQNEGRGFCNDAPSINSIPVTEVDEGVEYIYPLTAEDEENDNYTWTLVTGPDGMALDATNRIIWTPDDDSTSAPVPVTVMVADDFGGTDTQSFEITVTNVNDAPQITGQRTINIDEDTSYTVQLTDLTITDPDSTSFTLTVLAGTNYTVSGATVTPDADFNGNLTVNVTVNDGIADSAPYGLLITVGPVDDTSPSGSSEGGGGGGGGCFIGSLAGNSASGVQGPSFIIVLSGLVFAGAGLYRKMNR